MGWTAAQLLVKRIQMPDEPYQEEVWFEPELIIRESTTTILTTSPPKPRRQNVSGV